MGKSHKFREPRRFAILHTSSCHSLIIQCTERLFSGAKMSCFYVKLTLLLSMAILFAMTLQEASADINIERYVYYRGQLIYVQNDYMIENVTPDKITITVNGVEHEDIYIDGDEDKEIQIYGDARAEIYITENGRADIYLDGNGRAEIYVDENGRADIYLDGNGDVEIHKSGNGRAEIHREDEEMGMDLF